MSHGQPPHILPIVPCECGSTEAYWHGPQDGARVYCCDPCWEKRAGRSPWWLAEAAEGLRQNRERRGEVLGRPDRDYVREAGALVRGESRILPELEHVRALVDQLGGLLLECLEADRRNQSILLGFERGDYYFHERQERARILLARLGE